MQQPVASESGLPPPSPSSIQTDQQRNPVLFDPIAEAAAATTTSQQPVEEGEEFYEPNADDLRKVIQSLREEVKKQRTLLPKKFVEQKNNELMQNAYKHTVVRLRLFDRYVLQTQFVSSEPVSTIFDLIHDLLTEPKTFEIRQIPTDKLQPKERKTFLEMGIAPKCTLILKIIDQPSTDNIDGVLNLTKIRQCSQTEADSFSEQWLSVNTIYRPYLSTVLKQQQPLSLKQQQPPSSMNQDGQQPVNRAKPTSGSRPKWLPKNK